MAQVTLPDARTFEAPVGTPLSVYMRAAYPEPSTPVAAALVNGSLEELTYPVYRDTAVVPISITTGDGMRIYQRTAVFVLVVAMHEVLPGVRVTVDYSVTLGGVYCMVEGRDSLSPEELSSVQERMREIVEADELIVRQRMPVEDARALFAAQGYDSKARLLAYAEGPEVTVYDLRGVRDYFFGYMLPSTGLAKCFALQHHAPGFILRLPRRQDPQRLTPHRDYPKLTRVFTEYGHWLDILGIRDIGSLNDAVICGDIRKAILVAEALHEKHIASIAEHIAARRERIHLVLVAGPSSSGKTTLSRRLAIQLMANGLHPFALGLDDYFVDRELTPRDEDGEYDFEALEAVNVDLFSEQLQALMRGDSVRLARYNFQEGKSEWAKQVQLPEGALVIVEGIHGMNPRLVEALPSDQVYRVYTSALTQLNIDHHNRVPTTDTRLLRRIVRDAQFRGYTAQETIRRWDSVRRGEERYIFPHQENADVMFNSALVYELAVLKPFAEPLLLRVPRGTMEHIEARRLLAFLRWVRPYEPTFVPDNSILREFIGGSILRDLQF